MAELQEGKRYGVSCGKEDRVSSQPSVEFQGSQGLLKIPKVDSPNETHTFNFHMTNVGKDNPQGSFDCVQQMDSSSGSSQLSCLGLIQNKITVCATSDSYAMTRERVTQAEEESRNRSTKVIKPSEPFLGRRAQVRKAPQSSTDTAPERKRSTPMNPANTIRKNPARNTVFHRPYRDRVIHLLALRNYKKPELLARLQRDGVSQKDKNSLGAILHQVACLNPKDNSYSLKDYVFKDIQKDWPGYSETDKESLELILSRKLNPPQNAASTSHLDSSETSDKGAESTSQMAALPKTTENPRAQKRPLNSNFIDPLMNKRQRISHLSSRAQPSCSSHLVASSEKATADSPPLLPRPAAAAAPASLQLPSTLPSSSNPPQSASSSSPSTPEGGGTQDVPVDSLGQNSSSKHEDQQQRCVFQTPTWIQVPAAWRMKPPKIKGKKRSVTLLQRPTELCQNLKVMPEKPTGMCRRLMALHQKNMAKSPAQPPKRKAKPPAQPPKTTAKPPAQPPKTTAKPPAQPPKTTAKPPAQPPKTTAKPPAQPPKTTAQPPKTTAQPPKTTAQPPKTTAQPPKTTAQPPKTTAQPPKFVPLSPKIKVQPPKLVPLSPEFAAQPPKLTPLSPEFTPLSPEFTPLSPEFTALSPKFMALPPKLMVLSPKFAALPPKLTALPPKPMIKGHKGKSKMQDTTRLSEEEKGPEKEETDKLKELFSSYSDEGLQACASSAEPPSTSRQPDYLLKYTTIISEEQRQSYKNDFNAEYEEYRNLHARMESITRRFTMLEAQWKCLPAGCKEYQVLHEEVIEEYQKIKQSTPNYYEEKHRCEYLYDKLAHIKKLIGEYDSKQEQRQYASGSSENGE
ncbi:RNA polymerase II elongation factor ELL2 isoform X2 [Phalacrocorax aristotelis]|uniref:RNA polymerase II elongation factor ELL2 isoform X2 n=1 Tax=Phalacrocorax aristotelis TaxID=126867 RepID=UPI003F4C2B3B